MIILFESDNITAHINTQGTHKQRQGYYYIGLGIRFFGLVRVGFFGLRKIRLSKTINRSVLKETKNRHRKCQFFGSVFRCNRTEPSLILTERYQATVQTFQADNNQNISSNVKI